MGVVGAGVALFGSTAILHAVVRGDGNGGGRVEKGLSNKPLDPTGVNPLALPCRYAAGDLAPRWTESAATGMCA